MKSIKVSQLTIDGFFYEVVDADESPLEKGVFLLPAGTVMYDPPETIKEGFRYKYTEDGWVEEPIPYTDPYGNEVKSIYPHFYGNDKLDLFTKEEQLAVVTATLTNPFIKLIYDRLINALYLTLEDPETEIGLNALVEQNLITEERKEEIIRVMSPSN